MKPSILTLLSRHQILLSSLIIGIFLTSGAFFTAKYFSPKQTASVASLSCSLQSEIDAKIVKKAGLEAQATTTIRQITENNQAIIANATLLASTTIKIADLETKILSDYAISLEKAKVDAAEAEVKRLTYLLTALQRQPGTTKPTPAKFVKIQQVTLALAEAKTQRDAILNAYHNTVADNNTKKAELAALVADRTRHEEIARSLDTKANELNTTLNNINASITAITTEIANMQANLCPKITVLSPNGGELWHVGATVAIRWNSERMASSSVYIQLEDTRYTNDTAEHYSAIPANATPIPNTGEYQWTIPSTLGSGYMILGAGNVYKLLIANYADGSTYDQSDGIFSINSSTTPSITVLAPNGGETWQLNQSHTINWNSVGGEVVYSYLNFSDGGLCYMGSTTPALGHITVPANYSCPNIPKSLATGQYKAFLVLNNISDDSDLGLAHDSSDNYFTISAATSTPSSITVVSPNGGEIYKLNQNMNVVWDRSNCFSQKVRILLQPKTQPTNYSLPIYFSHTWDKDNTGSTTIFLADNIGLPPDQYKLRAACDPGLSAFSYGAFDDSDNYFTINSN